MPWSLSGWKQRERCQLPRREGYEEMRKKTGGKDPRLELERNGNIWPGEGSRVARKSYPSNVNMVDLIL